LVIVALLEENSDYSSYKYNSEISRFGEFDGEPDVQLEKSNVMLMGPACSALVDS